MSELLRLATELSGLEDTWERDGWPCHGKQPCLYSSEVLAVIGGYQDLIRRMAGHLDECRGLIVSEWGHSDLDDIIDEAKASIPEQ